MSRSRVFQFEPLSADDIKTLIRRALVGPRARAGPTTTCGCTTTRSNFWPKSATATPAARWARSKSACSRAAERPLEFTRALAEESVQRKAIEYDGTGDAHYDAISALIKSMRGSDPDAAIYWLARMLEAGEDVRFLARRIVILASEDVGNADPQALPLAVAAMQACEFVGLPECQLTLAQAVTYLACAPKSNAATVGIGEARARRPRGAAAAGAGAFCATAITQAPSGWGTARATSIRTTAPTRSPRRTTWASSANTTARSIAVRARAGRAAEDDSRRICAKAKAGRRRAGRASEREPIAPCRH